MQTYGKKYIYVISGVKTSFLNESYVPQHLYIHSNRKLDYGEIINELEDRFGDIDGVVCEGFLADVYKKAKDILNGGYDSLVMGVSDELNEAWNAVKKYTKLVTKGSKEAAGKLKEAALKLVFFLKNSLKQIKDIIIKYTFELVAKGLQKVPCLKPFGVIFEEAYKKVLDFSDSSISTEDAVVDAAEKIAREIFQGQTGRNAMAMFIKLAKTSKSKKLVYLVSKNETSSKFKRSIEELLVMCIKISLRFAINFTGASSVTKTIDVVRTAISTVDDDVAERDTKLIEDTEAAAVMAGATASLASTMKGDIGTCKAFLAGNLNGMVDVVCSNENVSKCGKIGVRAGLNKLVSSPIGFVSNSYKDLVTCIANIRKIVKEDDAVNDVVDNAAKETTNGVKSFMKNLGTLGNAYNKIALA